MLNCRCPKCFHLAGEPSLCPRTCTTESAHTLQPCSLCRNWTFCGDPIALDHSSERFCPGCRDQGDTEDGQLEVDVQFAKSEADIVLTCIQCSLQDNFPREYPKKQRAAKKAVLEPLCFASVEETLRNKDAVWIDAYTGQLIDFDQCFTARKSMRYNSFPGTRCPLVPSFDTVKSSALFHGARLSHVLGDLALTLLYIN